MASQRPSVDWAPSCPPGTWARAEGQLRRAGPGPRTTLHIRNLPCYFSRSSLVEFLGQFGLAKDVDFLYLPVDFQTEGSMGYAFVNLRSEAAAARCLAALNGFSRWPIPSKKVLSVDWSITQGFEANVRLVHRNTIMRQNIPEEYKPVVFSADGQVALFPSPEKKFPRHSTATQGRRT